MNDQNLMEDLLQLEKGACDLFMHGAIESSTQTVHKTFNSALNTALTMQDTIYTKMAAKGWYKTQPAEENKVSALKQKFSAQ